MFKNEQFSYEKTGVGNAKQLFYSFPSAIIIIIIIIIFNFVLPPPYTIWLKFFISFQTVIWSFLLVITWFLLQCDGISGKSWWGMVWFYSSFWVWLWRRVWKCSRRYYILEIFKFHYLVPICHSLSNLRHSDVDFGCIQYLQRFFLSMALKVLQYQVFHLSEIVVFGTVMSTSNIPLAWVSYIDQGIYQLKVLLLILWLRLQEFLIVRSYIQMVLILNWNLMGLLMRQSNLCSLMKSPWPRMKVVAERKECWKIVAFFQTIVCLVLLPLRPPRKREDH